MSRQGDFLIYCVETYKNAKHLTGRQVAELFTRYRVWDYVYSCFEALHTTGANYIVEDIDLYIKARQPATTSPCWDCTISTSATRTAWSTWNRWNPST